MASDSLICTAEGTFIKPCNIQISFKLTLSVCSKLSVHLQSRRAERAKERLVY